MTNKNFINYLKTIVDDNEISYFNSFMDYSKEKIICVYQKKGHRPPKHNSYGILPVTILVVYTKNADDAQKFTHELFNKIYHQGHKKIDDIDFFIDIEELPILLGKTEAGCFEYAIEAIIYFGKENN